MVYLTTLPVVNTVCSRILGWLMNDELERIWKETIIAYLKVLSWHSPGVAKKTTRNFNQVSPYPGQGTTNWLPPEHVRLPEPTW
jgi:hypothetical protein